jgi:lipopolysaccharide transport system permease protein
MSHASRAMAPTLIGPNRRHLRVRLAEVWRYRELLYFLTWRDVKVRYRHTVLGAAWALLQPLVTMGIFTVVFGRLAALPSDGQPYALFTLAALVPWIYFSTAMGSGANSLVGSEHLISKVFFPRLLIPAAAVITPLVDCAISLSLLLVVLVATGRTPGPALLLLPGFMLLAVGAALAAALWCSALNVAYRDVRYVLPFFLQAAMFATPVAYGASLVPEPWRVVYGLNPMASVVEGFRWVLLGTAPPGPMVAVSAAVVAVTMAAGFRYFRRMEATFADVL